MSDWNKRDFPQTSWSLPSVLPLMQCKINRTASEDWILLLLMYQKRTKADLEWDNKAEYVRNVLRSSLRNQRTIMTSGPLHCGERQETPDFHVEKLEHNSTLLFWLQNCSFSFFRLDFIFSPKEKPNSCGNSQHQTLSFHHRKRSSEEL